MTTAGPPAWRIVPSRAVEGGRLVVEAGASPFAIDPMPAVRLGGIPARVVAASSKRLSVIVPPEVEGGRVPVTVDGVDPPLAFVEIGTRMATDLHQPRSMVSSPWSTRNGTTSR